MGRAWERPKGIVGLTPSSGYAAALAGARLPRPGYHGFTPVATICRLLWRLRSFLAESQFTAPDLPQTCSNRVYEAKLEGCYADRSGDMVCARAARTRFLRMCRNPVCRSASWSASSLSDGRGNWRRRWSLSQQ